MGAKYAIPLWSCFKESTFKHKDIPGLKFQGMTYIQEDDRISNWGEGDYMRRRDLYLWGLTFKIIRYDDPTSPCTRQGVKPTHVCCNRKERFQTLSFVSQNLFSSRLQNTKEENYK